jgi:carboxylesterase type B
LNATDASQEIYDNLVKATSCADFVGKPESLDCLKALPFEEVNKALNGTGMRWGPAMDGDFIQNYPSVQIKNGNFPKIPIIIGENSDEGAAFGRRGINTDRDLADALKSSVVPSWVEETIGESVDEIVDGILAVYPNNQSVGIPSLETWPDVIESGTDDAKEFGMQYRRANAIFGDM